MWEYGCGRTATGRLGLGDGANQDGMKVPR